MNAKELRDNWNNFGHDIRNLSSESNATILRALDLLARTEESADELVRELREQHCRDFGRDPQCNMDNLCICDMHERAAAALVALKADLAESNRLYSLVIEGQEKLMAQTVRIRRAALGLVPNEPDTDERDTEEVVCALKAERDALKARVREIRIELAGLFTMLPGQVPGLPMEVCERDADRQCLFRAFELAVFPKEGA